MRRRRRLFHKDIGQHPPPLNEFFEEWTRPGQLPGRWAGNPRAWWSLKPTPPDEVRTNQRAFGVVFLAGGVALPIGMWALVYQRGWRLSGVGAAAVAVLSALLLVSAVLLLRAAFKQSTQSEPPDKRMHPPAAGSTSYRKRRNRSSGRG